MTKQEALDLFNNDCNHCYDHTVEDCKGCPSRVAIECIDKQIPKKPIRNTGQINKAWIEQAALCPTCKEYVGSYDCRIFNKFCQYCGQPIEPIDWGDEE